MACINGQIKTKGHILSKHIVIKLQEKCKYNN